MVDITIYMVKFIFIQTIHSKMITICLYPEDLGSPDKPQDTAQILFERLENSPPLPLDFPVQFKYGRKVRDILGGRGPARAYLIEVMNLLRKDVLQKVS